MLCLPPRHGKALALDTPIPTPNGWTTIGSLVVGDTVFDECGAPCTVTAVSDIWRQRPVYRVLTDDGDEIIADAEHEWLVRLCRKYPVQKLKTTQYLAGRKSKRAPMITAQGALQLSERNLPIDPYVLGVWLGDGYTNSAGMCSADPEILAEVSEIEGGHNSYATVGKTAHFRIGPHYRRGATQAETLQGRLRTLGLLGNKHIPVAYLRSSIRQRWDLLQGLVDTDGYVANDGQIEFCSTSEILAENVRELVSSLGHKASVIVGRATLYGRDCGPKYRVMFYAAGAARLPRKANKTRHGKRAFRRYIAIESAGIADTVCIEVDSPSHMFLCGKSMLPTHNSQLASRHFPAYYLGRNPHRQVISASASQELASDFGRDVRNIVGSQEYAQIFDTRLAEDNQAKGRWATAQGGSYYAVGVGSDVMGRGAHLLVIDDPFGTMADARSEAQRKAVYDWYTGTAYNRLEDNAAIVVIAHRMHEDDLSGKLLAQQAAGGDRWEVVELKALADDGSALWPEKYDADALRRIKSNISPGDWSALYQQNPTPDDGTFWLKEWFREYVTPPDRATMRIYGASDYAVTADGGDYTVHLVLGVDPSNQLWLLDLWRGQTATDKWIEAWCDLVLKWKPLGWAEETGQIKSGIGPFRDKMARERQAYVHVKLFPTRGDKSIRASSMRGRVAQIGLNIPANAPWCADLRQELLSFPSGKHDDQHDALGLLGQLLDIMVKGKPLPEPSKFRGANEMTMDEAWNLARPRFSDRQING